MLLKTINYLSFPGGLEGTLDPIEAMTIAKEHGFDGIELCIGDPGSALGIDATDARCDEIRQEAERIGIALPSTCSGLYWSRSLGDADPSARAQAKQDLEIMIRMTARLGGKTLLTIPGAVDVFFMPDRPPQPYLEVWENAKAGLREVLPIAEKHQVRLGIENVWNKFLTSPGELAWFIDQLESPWVGAYVDVANVLPYGYPEQWLRTLGKRVVGVHFKDFRRSVGTVEGFVDLLEGDVNWPEVMAALKEIGYDGAVAAEMLPGYRHYPEVKIPNTSRAMDAILGRS